MTTNNLKTYFKYQDEYQKKYGKKTVIFQETGGFVEIYGKPENPETLIDVCKIMNICVSRKKNPLMAGFPIHSKDRFINEVLNNFYTIVYVSQFDDPKTKTKKKIRKITKILSLGTVIESKDDFNNNIVSIFIDSYTKNKTEKYIIGISVIDLSVSKSYVYEIYDSEDMFNDVYRFIENFNPKELIINIKSKQITKDFIYDKIEFNNRLVNININKEWNLDINFIEIFLKKYYEYDYVIESLDLTRYNSLIYSFYLLLKYVEEHDETVLKKINDPIIWKDDKHLILDNNTLFQLNIVKNKNFKTNNKFECLFDVLNKNYTSMGKRLLRYRLLNPIINIKLLNDRYKKIEIMMKNQNSELDNNLKLIVDIERVHRKILLYNIEPFKFESLYSTYIGIDNVFKNINKNFYNKKLHDKFKNYLNDINKYFNLNLMKNVSLTDISESFIKEGYNDKIDNMNKEMKKLEEQINEERLRLSKLVGKDDCIKLINDGFECCFYSTNKRCKMLQNIDKTIIIRKKNKTNSYIINEFIENNKIKMVNLKHNTIKEVKKVYIELLQLLSTKYYSLFNNLSKFIAKIDYYNSLAKVSLKYGYNKPEIVESKSSFIDGVDVRHPIIERLNIRTEYIPNDINLNDDKKGMLLFGVNGCGKSSYLKSIGLNIILAQMGMFVAAKKFNYYPFNYIFTRILGNDNLLRGQSSFDVEMTELRPILKYSNNKCLVLGDEVCKGTEIISAMSIVGATINKLTKNNCKYIFTTHFHRLSELDIVKKNKNLLIKHFDITKNNNVITYGRKLKDGQGDTIYGIEIAKSIIRDNEFSSLALQIRKNMLFKNIVRS